MNYVYSMKCEEHRHSFIIDTIFPYRNYGFMDNSALHYSPLSILLVVSESGAESRAREDQCAQLTTALDQLTLQDIQRPPHSPTHTSSSSSLSSSSSSSSSSSDISSESDSPSHD